MMSESQEPINKVQGEEVKVSMPSATDLDMDNRDPLEINQHCKLTFEEILAEPDPGIFIFDIIWRLSFQIFTTTKLWCYRIWTLICGLPCAFCLGCQFATISFYNIWCWMPGIKALAIYLHCLRIQVDMCIRAVYEPCFYAMGKVFSSIIITVKKEG